MSSSGAAEEGAVTAVDKQRCKHCGTIVDANREARRAHRAVCELAPHRTRAEAAKSGSNNAENALDKCSEKAPLLQGSRTAQEVCQFCGRRHPSEECFKKLPAAHRERILHAHSSNSRSNIPWKDRLCVSPNLSAVDRRLEELYAKIVPRSIRVSQPWVTCDLCGKRLVATVRKLHEQQSCIVRGVLRRLNIIALLVDDEVWDNPEDMGKLETVIGELGVSPVLRDLPRAVRRAEQIAVLIGVVNAVVNVEDLFPEGEALSVDSVRRCLPTLEQRVDDWAESVRAREVAGQRRSGSSSPSSLVVTTGGSAGISVVGGGDGKGVSPPQLAVGDVFHAPPLARRVVGETGGDNGVIHHHSPTETTAECVSTGDTGDEADKSQEKSGPPHVLGEPAAASSLSRRRHQRATVDELARPTKHFSDRTLRIAAKRNKRSGTVDPPSKVLEAAQRNSSGGSSPQRPSSSCSSSVQRQNRSYQGASAKRQESPLVTAGSSAAPVSAVTLPPLGPRRSTSSLSNS